jgi:hypothetical protein
MIPRRHFKRFLAAYLGLAACGSAWVATAVLISAQPAVARAESPGAFARKVVTEIAANDYAAAWRTLHPLHQQAAPLGEYVRCESASPIPGHLQSLRVLRVADQAVRVPGVAAAVPGKAVSVRITIADRALDLAVVVDDTVHLVMVDGAWRWILPQRRYERYRDNTCGGGGPPPQVAS